MTAVRWRIYLFHAIEIPETSEEQDHDTWNEGLSDRERALPTILFQCCGSWSVAEEEMIALHGMHAGRGGPQDQSFLETGVKCLRTLV